MVVCTFLISTSDVGQPRLHHIEQSHSFLESPPNKNTLFTNEILLIKIV